jgi:hypothetical protein
VLCLIYEYSIGGQVDRILFRKPVDIGNLIRLTSRVTYSTGKITKEDCGEENVAKAVPAIMVEVLCNIINPEKYAAETE